MSKADRKKVLVVDDDESIQEIVKAILVSAGYEVAALDDSTRVVEKTQSWQPGLIILDMNMPGLTGWQLARELKNEMVTKNIPIVALTAHSTQQDVDEAHLAGCEKLISKPIDPLKFADMIADL